MAPRKRKAAAKPRPPISDEQKDFEQAVNVGLFLLRVVVGRSSACPVCFCNAIQSALQSVKGDFEHNELAPPLDLEDVRRASFEIGLSSEFELLAATVSNGKHLS